MTHPNRNNSCHNRSLRHSFALVSNLKNSDASSVVSPVVAGSYLSGWYINASCQYFSLTLISDAPSPKSRMGIDVPRL